MRADTFARLLVLEATVDAEIGYLLEHRPPPQERFREAMVARLGERVEEIDRVDAVAAARAYDALVDFLAELPEEGDDGVVEATVRFRRALERGVERAFGGREPADGAVWAGALDGILAALAAEHAAAASPRDELRVRALLHRARAAAERMTEGERPEHRAEARSALDRLAFAVLHRGGPVEARVHDARRLALRRRPGSLARIGAFVVAQLVKRRGVPGLAAPGPDPS